MKNRWRDRVISCNTWTWKRLTVFDKHTTPLVRRFRTNYRRDVNVNAVFYENAAVVYLLLCAAHTRIISLLLRVRTGEIWPAAAVRSNRFYARETHTKRSYTHARSYRAPEHICVLITFGLTGCIDSPGSEVKPRSYSGRSRTLFACIRVRIRMRFVLAILTADPKGRPCSAWFRAFRDARTRSVKWKVRAWKASARARHCCFTRGVQRVAGFSRTESRARCCTAPSSRVPIGRQNRPIRTPSLFTVSVLCGARVQCNMRICVLRVMKIVLRSPSSTKKKKTLVRQISWILTVN